MNRTSALAVVALATALLVAGCTLTLDPDQYAPKTAADCGTNRKVCGYKCVPLDDPSTGCGGASCEPCSPGANAIAACGTVAGTPSFGQCTIGQCESGWGDCNGTVPGCETRLNSVNNCGACGRSCGDPFGCDSAGFCTSTANGIGPSPGQVRGLVADPVNPSRVYYASDGFESGIGTGVIGLVDAPANLTYGYINSQPLGQVSGLAGNNNQLLFCSEGPIESRVGVFPSYAAGAPLFPPVTRPAGSGGLVAPGNAGFWWIPPGATQLFWSDVTSVNSLTTTPVGGWRAIASDRYTGTVYVADDASGGRILSFADTFDFASSQMLVANGAGEVGALAVRGSGIKEVYWGDLATGNVIRQVDGVRTTIYRGAGPTTRMRMAADDQGVYWLDSDNREVMEYLSGGAFGGVVIPLSLGSTPIELAVGTQRIFWTGPDTRELHSTTR